MQAVDINGIWGSNASDVWAVGSPDAIIHWDGSHLASLKTNTPQALNGVWGSNRSDIWVFSTGNLMWHSSGWTGGAADLTAFDGGWTDTWGFGLGEPIAAMWGSGGGDIWAVGPADTFGTSSTWHSAGWNAGNPLWTATDAGTIRTLPAAATSITFNASWGSGPDDVLASRRTGGQPVTVRVGRGKSPPVGKPSTVERSSTFMRSGGLLATMYGWPGMAAPLAISSQTPRIPMGL